MRCLILQPTNTSYDKNDFWFPLARIKASIKRFRSVQVTDYIHQKFLPWTSSSRRSCEICQRDFPSQGLKMRQISLTWTQSWMKAYPTRPEQCVHDLEYRLSEDVLSLSIYMQYQQWSNDGFVMQQRMAFFWIDHLELGRPPTWRHETSTSGAWVSDNPYRPVSDDILYMRVELSNGWYRVHASTVDAGCQRNCHVVW